VSSVWLTLAFTVDRYIMICHPFNCTQTHRQTTPVAVAVGRVSVIFCRSARYGKRWRSQWTATLWSVTRSSRSRSVRPGEPVESSQPSSPPASRSTCPRYCAILRYRTVMQQVAPNGPITIAIRARFEYDSSTIRLQHATRCVRFERDLSTIQHPTRSYVLSCNNEHVNSFALL